MAFYLKHISKVLTHEYHFYEGHTDVKDGVIEIPTDKGDLTHWVQNAAIRGYRVDPETGEALELSEILARYHRAIAADSGITVVADSTGNVHPIEEDPDYIPAANILDEDNPPDHSEDATVEAVNLGITDEKQELNPGETADIVVTDDGAPALEVTSPATVAEIVPERIVQVSDGPESALSAADIENALSVGDIASGPEEKPNVEDPED